MEVNDVLAFSEIIDFLLELLRDEDARARFEQDPEGTLSRAGLDGVSGEDVRDARLMLTDSGGVHAGDGDPGSSRPGADGPVAEINHTTRHYQADDNVQVVERGGFDGLVDRSTTVITIDDRDTIVVQDSFNADSSTTDVTVIDDSFNDIDVTDIDVIDIDAENSFNEDNDVVAIQDNDTVTQDNDTVAIQDNDTAVETDPVEDGDTVESDPGEEEQDGEQDDPFDDPGPEADETDDAAADITADAAVV